MAAYGTQLVILSALALLTLGLGQVQAMSCHDYVRANVLQDPDSMDEAKRIMGPLAATDWGTMTQQDAPVSSIPDAYWTVLNRRLQQECQQLPDETLEDIVATHLRAVARQKERAVSQAAETARKQAADAATHAHYKTYTDMLPKVINLTCRDYAGGGPKAALLVSLILAWSVNEDDHKEDTSWRELMHGAGALQVPRLDMTADQAKVGADKWCAAHPGVSPMMMATSIITDVYTATRLEKFGPENEDSPAKTAEKQKWAAEAAARTARGVLEQARASKAGPEGSCPYWIALMQQQGGRPSNQDMVSLSGQRIWDWCAIHPRATAAQLAASVPDR